jgi:hypothetical protein
MEVGEASIGLVDSVCIGNGANHRSGYIRNLGIGMGLLVLTANLAKVI